MAYIEESKRQKGVVCWDHIRLKGFPLQNASFDPNSAATQLPESEHTLLHNPPRPVVKLLLDDQCIDRCRRMETR